jgi:hypothetical protein
VAAQPDVVAAVVVAQLDVAAVAPDGEAVEAQPDVEAAAEAQRPDGVVAAVPQPDAVGVPGALRPDVLAAVLAGQLAAAPDGPASAQVDPEPARFDPAALTAVVQLRERAVSRRPELCRVGAAAVCRVRPDEAAAQGVPMRSAAPGEAALPARQDEQVLLPARSDEQVLLPVRHASRLREVKLAAGRRAVHQAVPAALQGSAAAARSREARRSLEPAKRSVRAAAGAAAVPKTHAVAAAGKIPAAVAAAESADLQTSGSADQ